MMPAKLAASDIRCIPSYTDYKRGHGGRRTKTGLISYFTGEEVERVREIQHSNPLRNAKKDTFIFWKLFEICSWGPALFAIISYSPPSLLRANSG